MALVKTYYPSEGGCVSFYDDCYETSEKQKEILNRVSEIVLRTEFKNFVKSQQMQKEKR